VKKRYSFIAVLLLVIGVGWFVNAQGGTAQQSVAAQVIAREKASVEAWQRKDKAFFAELLTDDATYFSAYSPYLDTDARQNLLPRFEQYTEQFKYQNFQMYNPRVQVYGDTAVLTYNAAVSASFNGQPLHYTAKMTAVYVRQGNIWRAAHGHESMNPAPR